MSARVNLVRSVEEWRSLRITTALTNLKKEESQVKKIAKVVKMELPGGEAKPGPKLASAGVNMGKFCTDFNAKTADRKGEIVPVIITAYEDKSCDFVIKTSPVAGLILKAAGIQKGRRALALALAFARAEAGTASGI